jgi:hypothetical protein
LAVYQRQAELDDAALAAELGTLPEIVVRLALCQRPDANSSDFAAQVNALSDFTLIDETLLRRVIEQAEQQVERAAPASNYAIPLAARLTAWRDWARALTRHPIPVIAGAICLMVAAAIGALIWRESSKPSTPSVATHHKMPTAVPTAAATSSPTSSSGAISATPSELLARASTQEIDLENYTPLRDVGGSRSGGQVIPLQPVLTNFLLTLPERSKPGRYHISIVDANGQPLTKEKEARSRDGKKLTVMLDLSGLPEKPCRLRITREGEGAMPGDYPAVIAK